MLIDWFTVSAQALNFLVLVWLMKRFLYKPILHAIDAREKRIAETLAAADSKQAEAQQEREAFQHKNEVFDQQRSARMNEATEEAKRERQRLLEEARQAAEALRAKQMETLRKEAHDLKQAFGRMVQQEVLAISRKVLKELATASLEERLVDHFIRRLRAVDGSAKETLAEALKTSPDGALVRSAFDLPEEQRATIQHALNETFSAEVRVRYETAPEVVSGIELITQGQKVAWSIAEYLTSLEKNINVLLKEKEVLKAEEAPKSEDPENGAKPQ